MITLADLFPRRLHWAEHIVRETRNVYRLLVLNRLKTGYCEGQAEDGRIILK
jgi:hypothetical protein